MPSASRTDIEKMPEEEDERVVVSKFRSVHLKWTSEEDSRLQEAVQKYGARDWKHVAEMVGTRSAGVQKYVQTWKDDFTILLCKC